jgi:hypothetical protein
MARPLILLIDEHQARVQQFKTVFEFMEYQIDVADSTDYPGCLEQTDSVYQAVFIGSGIDKLALVIKTVADADGKVPIILSAARMAIDLHRMQKPVGAIVGLIRTG